MSDLGDSEDLWAKFNEVEKAGDPEDAEPELYTLRYDDDGNAIVDLHIQPATRTAAASLAGLMRALLDTGEFNREEAFEIVSLSCQTGETPSLTLNLLHGSSDGDE
jgi:hypothetical protein